MSIWIKRGVLRPDIARWLASEWAFHNRTQRELAKLIGYETCASVSKIISQVRCDLPDVSAPNPPHFSDAKTELRQLLGGPVARPPEFEPTPEPPAPLERIAAALEELAAAVHRIADFHA